MYRLMVAGAALAPITLLAACDDAVRESTEMGEARPDGRAVPVEVADEGITPPRRWPDACSLLTEDELRAVLPNIQTVTRTVEPQAPYEPGRRFDHRAPEGNCEYDLTLPVSDLTKRHRADQGDGLVAVTLTAVGAPDAVARAYAAQKSNNEKHRPPHPPDHRGGHLTSGAPAAAPRPGGGRPRALDRAVFQGSFQVNVIAEERNPGPGRHTPHRGLEPRFEVFLPASDSRNGDRPERAPHDLDVLAVSTERNLHRTAEVSIFHDVDNGFPDGLGLPLGSEAGAGDRPLPGRPRVIHRRLPVR